VTQADSRAGRGRGETSGGIDDPNLLPRSVVRPDAYALLDPDTGTLLVPAGLLDSTGLA